MPDRNPVEVPPYNLVKRFRAHPVAALALWSVIAGAAMAADSVLPGPTVSVTLQAMPDIFRLWVALSMVLGGVLASAGLLGHWERADRSWKVEKAGWRIVFGAWMIMAAAAIYYNPVAIIAWGDFLTNAVIAIVRQNAVCRIEKQTLQRMELSE